MSKDRKPPSETRNLTTAELRYVDDALRRLREHFHEWSGYENDEVALIDFAFYEGCGGTDHCGEILATAAPFAVGSKLVKNHGYTWVMIRHGDGWHYGLEHRLLEPIDLQTLEDGGNVADQRGDPQPGKRTLRAFAGLANYSCGVKKRKR